MSRTALWIITVLLLPVAGVMGLIAYIELHAGHSFQPAFYVFLMIVWYLFLTTFFAAVTGPSSFPNRMLAYPWVQLGKVLSAIDPRFCTGTIVLGVLTLLAYWAFMMPVDYIVLVENYICKSGSPKPTTLWPGVIVLFIGYISLNHLVHGEAYVYYRDNDDRALSDKTQRLHKRIKWALIMIAVVLCLIALSRLGSFSLLKTTLTSGASVMGSILLFVAALAVIIFIMLFFFTYKQNRIDKQVMHDLDLIPVEEREAMVNAIDHHARESEYTLMHCRFVSPNNAETLAVSSHFGGTPYLEDLNEFPCSLEEHQTKADFVLQLTLSAKRLGEVWQGRLITVYMFDWDWTLTIRSYQDPSINKQVSIPDYSETYRCLAFSPLAVPYVPEPPEDVEYSEEDEDHISGYDVESLIKLTPGLKEKLEKYTKHEDNVLSRVIDPQFSDTYLDMGNLILEGGDPVIIQNPHDAHCPICQKKMRFLFQFGEVSDELHLGDAGQVYIYGCDDHPEQCEGFIDCY